MMTMMMSAAARTTTFGREVHADPQRLADRQKKKNEKHDFLRQTAFSLLHWAQQQQPPQGKSSSPSSAPPPPREKEKDIPKKMKQGVVDDADDDDVSSEEEKKATAAAAGTWWRTSVQHLLPTDLHVQESTHLLTLLYAIGIIPAYIRAAYAAHIDAVHDGIEAEDETNDARDAALFSSYFNCTHLLTENNTTTTTSTETTVLSSSSQGDRRGDIQLDESWTDNFGRIISLSLRGGPWNMNTNHGAASSFRLPPIIQAFTNLERLHLTQCQHLPIAALGTLTSLQSLVFQDCPQTMFRNLPPGMKLTLPALTKVCIRTRTSHHHRQRDCGGSGGHDDDEKEEDTIPKALQLFSKRRAGDSEALVKMSRNMDRPGKLFFVTFVIPIILDGIFHKIAPKIFGPNMFGMFQRQDIGFKQIQRKKRWDRVVQLVMIGGILTTMGMGLRSTIQLLARRLEKSQLFVSASLAMTGALGILLKKTVAFLGTKQKEWGPTELLDPQS
mmetsp:Transcript_9259/g.10545  ORF Transcript_9259/g.10545 Transcript_9259/m.10545 type:complete len:499 (-) Transcript_9259:151-1647(-)